MSFAFELLHTDGRARRGTLRTPHGVVQTPVFMPVGTQGAVKALTHAQLEDGGRARSFSATPTTCTCAPAIR